MRVSAFPVLGVAGFGALALGAMAAGCSSSPRVSRSTSTTARPTTTSTPTTSSTTQPTSTTTVASAASARCQPTDLVGSVSGSEGAAGTIELTLQLRNSGTHSCGLQGYPGAQLISSTGTELPTQVVRGGSYPFTDFAPAPVNLAPGESAYVNFGYSDVPRGSEQCPPAASMWVTPPDDVDHLVITTPLTVCNGGTLTTSPVFAADSPQVQTTAPKS